MMLGRVVSTSFVAAVLAGCFAEPGGDSDAAGGTAESSGTGTQASSGAEPVSSSGSGSSMSASGTGTGGGTSSAGTSVGTSGGVTSGSTGETSGGSTETATGQQPLECDDGFGELSVLTVGEAQTVSFFDAFPQTEVGVFLEQGGAVLAFEYGDVEAGGAGFTWTFSATIPESFVPGPALLRFNGLGENGVPFESSCEIVLD
ncbi:MAG: hypothetical protein ACRBN8_27195 [Nannocystales bacterium]